MDSRAPRDGKTIEEVGTYDPMKQDKSQRVTVKQDRVDYWLSVGAQPTEKVGVLLRKVRENSWGVAKSPAPMQAPKVPEAPAEESAEATEETAAE